MKKLFLVFSCSLLLFLITCWSAALSGYVAGFTESICYFTLTYIALTKYAESGISGKETYVVLAIILGRIVFELPVRFIDFWGSLVSLGITIVVIACILLAWLCFKEKRMSVYILSIIIIILLNTFVLSVWENVFSKTGTTIPIYSMGVQG